MMPFEGEEYLYVLTNRSLPGLVKIGRTDRNVEDRVRELSSHTGVPTAFLVFREFRVRDSVSAERAVHLRLKDYRVSGNREFFTIEPEIAAEVIEELVGRAQTATYNSEAEDELLAKATTLAAQYGKIWPSMLGSMLHISHTEAENLIGILKGRGMIDNLGKAIFSSPQHPTQENAQFAVSPPDDAALPQDDRRNYQFPPLDLLTEPNWNVAVDEQELRKNAETLLSIFSEWGLDVILGEIHVGPVFTRYEFSPVSQAGIEKLSAIEGKLISELNFTGARVLSSVPGKTAIGVEIPNRHPRTVEIREILESEDWCSAKAILPIALGKEVGGRPIVQDLAKMRHLLVVGARESGKRTCLNSVVASILYSKSPSDVRFIMVDPTVIELRVFNSLPHMLIPVVTDPLKVPVVLRWLLSEMQQRFQIFALVNTGNIAGFNNRQRTSPISSRNDDIELPARLPHVVLIINELADPMIATAAETESLIARLAQHGGTAGIHLIIATERPSADVVTDVIKSSLPVRVAFKVGSQLESRAILGVRGAETLIGRGDMLVTSSSLSHPMRLQGAFVGDREIAEVCEFLKRNGPPQYAYVVQQSIDRTRSAAAINEESDLDEERDLDEESYLDEDEQLFLHALDFLKSTRCASTSMMQRRLRIGYNRVARIMDLMEEKGIVGPENGSSPREILVDLDRI